MTQADADARLQVVGDEREGALEDVKGVRGAPSDLKHLSDANEARGLSGSRRRRALWEEGGDGLGSVEGRRAVVVALGSAGRAGGAGAIGVERGDVDRASRSSR